MTIPHNSRTWFRLTDDELARLNPPFIVEFYRDEDGNQCECYADDDQWHSMGHVPRPQTRLGWFCHHVMHGLMMRYPLYKVVGWSFWHSFIEPNHEMEAIDATQ